MRFKILLGVMIGLGIGWAIKNGIPVCQAPGGQGNIKVVALNGDRIAILWEDGRAGHPNYTLYMQVLDSTGRPLFQKDGIMIPDTFYQRRPEMVTDGKYLYIVYEDYREGFGNGNIYLTKINGLTGKKEGGKDIPICIINDNQEWPQLCLDESKEGAFICWVDYREYEITGRTAIYCARVDKDGKVVFEKKVGEGTDPVIVPSNQSCIVFWFGKERDTVGVYGQRVSPQGELLWREPKLIIPKYGWFLESFQRLPGGVPYPYAISDMKGGALVYYYQGPERIDSLGNRYGIYYTFPFSVFNHIISNGASGLIGTTGGLVRSPSGGITQRVYITQIEGDGDIPWGKADVVWENPNPRPDTEPFPPMHPTVARGPHKSCVVAWSAETNTSLGEDIFFQRIDSLGKKVYEKPLVICKAKDTQHYPYVVESNNGWWIIWEDLRDRDVNGVDIYAAFVDSSGRVGIEEEPTERVLKADIKLLWPNPFTKRVEIAYQIPYSEIVSLRVYDVQGRLVKKLIDRRQNPGTYRIIWDGKDINNRDVSSGIYFLRLSIKGKSAQIVRKVVLFKKEE